MAQTMINQRNPSLRDYSPNSSTYNSEKATMTDTGDHSQLAEINETGHVQEVERNFSLLSICSVGLVTGNTWAALGGSIATAIYNGGPPGVLYEFIAVSMFYWLIAASLAELASSMPSSAGVYHWASITPGPKYGRICGWFAGWWNTFAWICGTVATMSSIASNIAVAMYGLYHPGYVPARWHIFIGYVIVTWISCSIVLFANRALPLINNIGLAFILGGVFITVVVCAVMPSGTGHATHSFIWTDWVNDTGYSNNGFVFLAGMLNGAYAIGTPDCVSHLAEEIPNPKRNVPLAIAAQMTIGFVTAFIYTIAICTTAGTTGLLFVIFFPIFCTLIGTYITAGRCLWTLARDGAVPYSSWLHAIDSHEDPRDKSPFNATIACGIWSTVLGAIYVGSSTAFNAFIGSFVVLLTLSYLAAILPFIFTGRFTQSNQASGAYNNRMVPGWFVMNNFVGYIVNVISCLYIVVFVVIYCFPYAVPFNAASMNYSCLIAGALSLTAGVWWLVKGGSYKGPQAGVHGQLETDNGRNMLSVISIGRVDGLRNPLETEPKQ
ncbi:hypothetical protein SS1G_14102 [Sclerotinia sclerotiorum 1980 UF-70]|uniref:Choline transport protein n=1 Tax=Sclerotinia sclerotiorum (strain ATCC 18683 / 1980 / Ss-1) TaxID=665079 RepID=A7F921_SCLS1|nr:hypothetical protein SS1G_14102 [Sclerotinia sclerotiorum 1980 UF-70]EDN99242.1 hypothetical protein SS1G_14102 [Sclerotinia sclerotiorum 1980 UF-70]